jgi:5'-3' exoribonuclease 1
LLSTDLDRIITQIVKPKVSVFMAIDGVAPRAKLNQQRSRRFRSAKDMAEATKDMEMSDEDKERGSVHVFDSNCITPGTDFMAKVSDVIKYFIRKKIKEDPLWRNLKIIFSGHEIPGEGEHKIMSHIREMKSQPGYQPNTRHVMYGQDADLIMLGLVSHEPHFTLLREIVNFGFSGGQNSKNALKTVMRFTKESDFQLLHLSVLREYLQLEFMRVPNPEIYDLERVVDDFVFLTFLVGNDFLPHLPALDIGDGAFDLLFDTYKKQRSGWGQGQYLTFQGEICDAARLEAYLVVIGSVETEVLTKKEDDDAAYTKKKRRWNKRDGLPDGPSDDELAENEASKEGDYMTMIENMLAKHSPDDFVEGWKPIRQAGEKDFKGRYYYEKLGFTPVTVAEHKALRKAYIEGLMWCLAYYYRGCISWGWFFPYHYGPMLSDLTSLPEIFSEIKFELGEPLFPFEQLMGCLPPASSALVPKPFHALMTSPQSPIIAFYPEDFVVDMNGKKNPWEGVNVLPFIDVKLLKNTIAKHCPPSVLTPAENRRNSVGNVYLYTFDLTANETVPSPNRKIGLTDIQNCNSRVDVFDQPERIDIPFKPELVPGTQIPFPGFPSLNVLPILKNELTSIGLNCFGTPSKYPNMVLSLHEMPPLPPVEQLADNILGKSLYVNWPMMHEARVVAITDSRTEIRFVKKKAVVKKYTAKQQEEWKSESDVLKQAYLVGYGVPGAGGVEIGEIQYRLKLLPLQGMRKNPANGSTKKVFGTEEADVPLQLALWKAPAPDPRFIERGPISVFDRFPGDSNVVLTKGKYRGCKGVVVGSVDDKKIGVKVKVMKPEPPFGLAIARSVQESYISSGDAARLIKLHPNVFGKIMGGLLVDPGRFDLGLNLKYSEGLCIVGYTRKKPDVSDEVKRKASASGAKKAWGAGDSLLVVGSKRSEAEEKRTDKIQWEYSPRAIRLVSLYRQKFPQLFAAIAKQPNERKYNASTMFGSKGPAILVEIREWLNTVETAKMPRSPVSTEAMPTEAIQAIQKAADVRTESIKKLGPPTESLVKVPSSALYREASTSATDVLQASDVNDDLAPELGDRIVNLCATGIPFGARGTVVGIHDPASGCVEVLMDEEFVGGGNLQGACSNFRGKLCVWAHLLRVSPENSKSLVDKLVPKGSGKAAVERIIAGIEAQSQPEGKEKKGPAWGGAGAVHAKKEAISPATQPETPVAAKQKAARDTTPAQSKTPPRSATRKTGGSTGRHGSTGRGKQGVWREARGPDEKGIGFKGPDKRKGPSGLQKWKAFTNGGSRVSASKSAGLKSMLGVAPQQAAPAQADASAGLKEMLGVTSQPPNPPPADASAGLKAMLGVQSTPPMPQQQQYSLPPPPLHAMGHPMAPGYPMPHPSMAMGFQNSPPPQPSHANNAADKLLQMMQLGPSANEQMGPPMQQHQPSSFNFTYVEEGKDAPPPQQQHGHMYQQQPQSHQSYPPHPQMMMQHPPMPMPMGGMHMPPPPPPPNPRFDLANDEFPALGAEKKSTAQPTGVAVPPPPLPKKAAKPPQPIIPSVVR